MSDVVIRPSTSTVVVRPSTATTVIDPAVVAPVIDPTVVTTVVDPTVVSPTISPVFGEPGPAGAQGPAGPAGPGGASGYYGSFYDTTTQTNDLAVNTMSFDTTTEAVGVQVVTGTQITVAQNGVYNLQFSAQFDKTDSGDDTVEIWLAKNGTDVDWSNTTISLHGNDAKEVPAWNFLLSLNANDFIELKWYSADTDMRILARPPQTGPDRPAIPSIIMTVQQVMYTQAGPTGPTGPAGPAGPTFTYVHTQAVAATVWTVSHNLGGYPNVTVVDSAGDIVEPDYEYLSNNQIRITLAYATSGHAYLS